MCTGSTGNRPNRPARISRPGGCALDSADDGPQNLLNHVVHVATRDPCSFANPGDPRPILIEQPLPGIFVKVRRQLQERGGCRTRIQFGHEEIHTQITEGEMTRMADRKSSHST